MIEIYDYEKEYIHKRYNTTSRFLIYAVNLNMGGKLGYWLMSDSKTVPKTTWLKDYNSLIQQSSIFRLLNKKTRSYLLYLLRNVEDKYSSGYVYDNTSSSWISSSTWPKKSIHFTNDSLFSQSLKKLNKTFSETQNLRFKNPELKISDLFSHEISYLIDRTMMGYFIGHHHSISASMFLTVIKAISGSGDNAILTDMLAKLNSRYLQFFTYNVNGAEFKVSYSTAKYLAFRKQKLYSVLNTFGCDHIMDSICGITPISLSLLNHYWSLLENYSKYKTYI